MGSAIDKVGEGLGNAGMMAWEVWWALMLGFAVSAVVQAWVPRERIQSALSGAGAKPVTKATLLGAASSSCSYAAIAIARSLLARGASAASALAFQFASTNLVWELGLVLWVLLGWEFTLAEFVGGVVMIVSMSVLLRAFVSPRLEAIARDNARLVEAGHEHGAVGATMGWRQRVRSLEAWTEVAQNFRADVLMLWKEIATGILLAGFIGLLGGDFFNGLFVSDAPEPLRSIENVLVGPLIAVLSFVCSVGNIPLAAVLWSGGISFAGALAFIFADLIVLPIVLAYRKYYGGAFAFRISALMLVTMILAALTVDGVFGVAGLIPTHRPDAGELFGSVEANYKLYLNLLGSAIFISLFTLAARRPAASHACEAHGH